MEKTKNTYSGIDLFKLVASTLVVLLHSVETTAWYPNEVKFVFTRLAVPFFFITSGFFFYKGLNKAKDKRNYFVNYEKKLLILFVIWGILLYSPVTISTYIKKYPDAGVLKLLFYYIRRVFIIGPGPYWYLVALMWSATFLYFCYRKKNNFLVIFGIIFGFVLEISYACFQGILSNILAFNYLFKAIYVVYSFEFNFIMFGIPFMGIGYLISENGYAVKPKISTIILISSTLLRVIEYNLPKIFSCEFWNDNNISFAFIIQAISFFMLAKELKLKLDTPYSLAIRQLSSCIYFSHAIILYNILNPIIDEFTNLPTYAPICICPKVIVVLILCTILFISIKKVNNKYLNILING